MRVCLILLFCAVLTPGLKAALYVTEAKVAIDRCASAWFIKRFMDPTAEFAFFNSGEVVPNGVGFGFYGAPYFNKGRDCTFTALVRAAEKTNVPTLQKMNDLVNDTLAWRQGPSALANRLRIGIDDVRVATQDDQKTILAVMPAFDLLYLKLGGDVGAMRPEAAVVISALPTTLIQSLAQAKPTDEELKNTMESIRSEKVRDEAESLKRLYLLVWDSAEVSE